MLTVLNIFTLNKKELEKLIGQARVHPDKEIITSLYRELTYPYDKKQKLLGKVEKIEIGDVAFIQGLHRSGTTTLYGLLRDVGFNCFDLYKINCYDQLIYNKVNDREQLVRKGLDIVFDFYGAETRVYDEIEVNSYTVEEYNHITSLVLDEVQIEKTYNLFKRINYAMKYEKLHRINQKNISKLFEIIKKIRYVSDNEAPVILKNPFDLTKFKFLKDHLPSSKFIFLHRYPPKAVTSIFKALRKDYSRTDPVYYLYLINRFYKNTFNDKFIKSFIRVASRFRLSIPVLMLRAALQVRKYRRNLHKIDSKDFITTTYLKMCSKPNETVDRINHFLGHEAKDFDLSDKIEVRKYSLPLLIHLLRPAMRYLFGSSYYSRN